MTFEVEVAANNEMLDSVRQRSDLGVIDSNRSLSEILNEGDFMHLNRDELLIHSKVQQRQSKFRTHDIDTIVEDDKENMNSVTSEGRNGKASGKTACSSTGASVILVESTN